jgi:hypothetical protein
MQAIASGFGLNFYGFFVFAVFWVVAYFFWATRMNLAERNREQRAGAAPRDPTEHGRTDCQIKTDEQSR